MAFNLAAADGPPKPPATSLAGTAPVAGKGESGDDVLCTASGVPQDSFADFLVGDDEGEPTDMVALTEEEERWVQEQVDQFEQQKQRDEGMMNMHVTMDELEDEMEHWLNAVEPEPGSAPVTPRGAGRPRMVDQARVIDVGDPRGEAYTKAEFTEFYGGAREYERALHAAKSGILWEVVHSGGIAWCTGPRYSDIAEDGSKPVEQLTRGPVRQVQSGFVCDATTKLWLPMQSESGAEQFVVLREREPRRIADDGQPYTEEEFRSHYGGLKEWEKAKPEVADLKDLERQRELLKSKLEQLEQQKAKAGGS
eukprot:TRINITY_DN2235_c3_g1_i1.p1 TRINITY_DN2235_c3_g1~~TRINITY_DN2235_c3_g1_i1.p1  ORF type:complete len:327 (+),score=98.76 TRINITY_DN2235_c3_g1_i1:56-982(+)